MKYIRGMSTLPSGMSVALAYSVGGLKMAVPLLKFISTICLSIVLIGSGAAWALQHCRADSKSAEHAHIALTGELLAPNSNSTDHHRPHGRIHCPDHDIATLSFGPLSSLFRLQPPNDNGVAFLNSRLPALVATRFAWILRISVRPHLSPHLILSKLRI